VWVFRDCCFLCACLNYPTLIPLRRKSAASFTNGAISHLAFPSSPFLGLFLSSVRSTAFTPAILISSRFQGDHPLLRDIYSSFKNRKETPPFKIAGGRPSGGSRDWDPGPPWRFFLLLIMAALSRAAQRPLDPSSRLHSSQQLECCCWAAPTHDRRRRPQQPRNLIVRRNLPQSLRLFGLSFATREMPPFVCESAPHTTEDGRPALPCGSRVFTSSLRSLPSGLNPPHLQHQRALCMQKICNPTSWTPSRFQSMCRPARFR